MRKLRFYLCILLLFTLPGTAPPQEGEGETGFPAGEEAPDFPFPEEAAKTRWYRSNSAGMALEFFSSRAAALRNQYGLSVGPLSPGELPEQLLPYYVKSFRIELRTLYEDGLESRRQFLFIDRGGITRLIAVLVNPEDPGDGDEGGAGGEAGAGAGSRKGPQGFIEIFNEDQMIAEARRLPGDGSEYITRYIYRNGVLIRAENLIKENPVPEPETGPGEAAGSPAGSPPVEAERPVNTDYYRYTRSGSLRMVERIIHQTAGQDEPLPSVFRFPPLTPNAPPDPEFVRPTIAYSSEFFQDIIQDNIFRVVYTTDDKGRVLVETRQDESGKTLGEIHNTWSGDRLMAVEWISGEDERRTEYEYDGKGNRIAERNFNRGILERLVRLEGGREVEDLYMNGLLIMRAIWEDGRKISEERIRPSPPPRGGTPRGNSAGDGEP